MTSSFFFRTNRERFWVVVITGVLGSILFGSFLVSVFVLGRSALEGETGVPAPFVMMGLILLILAAVMKGSSSQEEIEAEKKDKLLENGKIVAEAIAKNYPYVLLSDPMPYDTTYYHILNDHVIEFARCFAEHGSRHNELCHSNSVSTLNSLEKTLAILAKRFDEAGKLQEKHQAKIDQLARNGKELSHADVENLFNEQELLDKVTSEAKDGFWKVHGAAKAIGLRVYPKYGWYLLLWHPGLES